jgi:hypothetical protein
MPRVKQVWSFNGMCALVRVLRVNALLTMVNRAATTERPAQLFEGIGQ